MQWLLTQTHQVWPDTVINNPFFGYFRQLSAYLEYTAPGRYNKTHHALKFILIRWFHELLSLSKKRQTYRYDQMDGR